MGGYLHFIQGWAAEIVGPRDGLVWTDGGTIAASGFSGSDDAGQPVVAVHRERPAEFSLPRGKKATESVHVEKFRMDSRSRGGGDPFVTIRPTKVDPPDFIASDQRRKTVGIECTALADESRRSAYGALRALKRRLEIVGPSQFRHLRDCALYVYFGDTVRPNPPRSATEDMAYEGLIDAIRTLIVDRSLLWQEGPRPSTPPSPSDIGIQTTPFGDSAHAAPVNDDYQPTRFMARMGFDLVLGYTTVYRLSEVQELMRNLIRRKDKAGNDWLLITAGGPNAQGLTFAGEEFVAGLLFDHEFAFPPPSNIERILLHRWGVGDACELFPGERRLLVASARPDLPEGLTYVMPALPTDLFPERNAPCPCGSGRAFKRCHGGPTPFAESPSALLIPGV